MAGGTVYRYSPLFPRRISVPVLLSSARVSPEIRTSCNGIEAMSSPVLDNPNWVFTSGGIEVKVNASLSTLHFPSPTKNSIKQIEV